MDKGGILGDTLEAVKEEAEQMTKTAVRQITGKQKQQRAQPPNVKLDKKQPDEATKKFVESLYQGSSQMTQKEQQQQEIEDKQKIEALRQRLHSEYYQQLTTRPKQEPRPAEKVETEKRQELQKLQEKEVKKPPPLPVQRASQKIEKFRGVSG